MASSEKYQLQKVLGSGSFGYVFLAIHTSTNAKKAIKRIEKVGTQLSREFEVLSELKDLPHCVQMQECFFTKNDEGKLVQNIVFEFLENDLERIIGNAKMSQQFLPCSRVLDIGYQLFKGIADVHALGVIHRDLKPENVLIGANNLVKICDFGSSKFLDAKGKNTPYIVSRYYRAPELFLCITDYDGCIDVWAAGCILAELVSLRPLFRGKSEGEQLFAIFKLWGSLSEEQKKFYGSKVPFSKSYLSKFPKYAKDEKMIEQLFADFERKRELIDFLNKVFNYNSEERMTAAQAIAHPLFAGQATKYKSFMRSLGN